MVASVALVEDDLLVAEYSVNYKEDTFADTASDVG